MSWGHKPPADRRKIDLGRVARASVCPTSGRSSAGTASTCYARHMTAGRPLLLDWSVPGGAPGGAWSKVHVLIGTGCQHGRLESQNGLTPCGGGPLPLRERSPDRAPGRAGAGRVLAVPARGARPHKQPVVPADGGVEGHGRVPECDCEIGRRV